MRKLRGQPLGFFVLAFVLAALSVIPAGHCQNGSGAAETQYLMFQLFTAGPGFTTQPGQQVISRLPDPDFLDGEAQKILDTIGTRGDDRHRLGVVVGPLALDYTDAQLQTLIEWTFAIASKHKIAVGLHIDDSKFWLNRRDLWSDPANVEWLDWKGTPNTGQYLNWGRPWRLAPQACFNSPAMLNEAKRLSGAVIGPAIAAGIEKLRESGDEALFAGVIAGWETAIGLDYETHRHLGYCALTNLGFSESSPPPDPDRELEAVVQNWIGAWSGSLAGAGVPHDKIYCHIAFKPRNQSSKMLGQGGMSYSRSVLYTPPSVAINRAYRPGYSTYPNAGILTDIYAALGAHGVPPWASAEGTNVDIQSAPPVIPDTGMEDYLARMFNHGAVLTTVFGWGIGSKDNLFRRATESGEAIAAYRKFLHGVHLEEKPLAASYRDDRQDLGKASGFAGFDVAVLQQQMRALPQKIETFHQRHSDMREVKQRVESIQRLIGAGELKKAFDELQLLNPVLESP